MKHKSPDYKLSAVRRTTKTKIYTLCEGQTLLIFFGIKRAILNLQGCKYAMV